MINNFRGRKETLVFKSIFGHNNRYNLYYFKPFVDKNQRFGFGFDIYSFSLESGGADSAFWRPMGVAVIFGLLFGTILTLVVVPVMYSVFSDTAALFGKKNSAKG